MELRYCEKCGDIIKLEGQVEKINPAEHFLCPRCSQGADPGSNIAPDSTFEGILDQTSMNLFSPSTLAMKRKEQQEKAALGGPPAKSGSATAGVKTDPLLGGSSMPARTARKLQFRCLHCKAMLMIVPVKKASRMVCPKCKGDLFIDQSGIVSKTSFAAADQMKAPSGSARAATAPSGSARAATAPSGSARAATGSRAERKPSADPRPEGRGQNVGTASPPPGRIAPASPSGMAPAVLQRPSQAVPKSHLAQGGSGTLGGVPTRQGSPESQPAKPSSFRRLPSSAERTPPLAGGKGSETGVAQGLARPGSARFPGAKMPHVPPPQAAGLEPFAAARPKQEDPVAQEVREFQKIDLFRNNSGEFPSKAQTAHPDGDAGTAATRKEDLKVESRPRTGSKKIQEETRSSDRGFDLLDVELTQAEDLSKPLTESWEPVEKYPSPIREPRRPGSAMGRWEKIGVLSFLFVFAILLGAPIFLAGNLWSLDFRPSAQPSSQAKRQADLERLGKIIMKGKEKIFDLPANWGLRSPREREPGQLPQENR